MHESSSLPSKAVAISPLFPTSNHPKSACGACAALLPFSAPELHVPHYLRAHYWWAYIHPKALKLFERQWLVNLILWGNYARLRDAALAELGKSFAGKTLQVACVYGDLTSRLCECIAASGGSIDVVDVLPVQLRN